MQRRLHVLVRIALLIHIHGRQQLVIVTRHTVVHTVLALLHKRVQLLQHRPGARSAALGLRRRVPTTRQRVPHVAVPHRGILVLVVKRLHAHAGVPRPGQLELPHRRAGRRLFRVHALLLLRKVLVGVHGGLGFCAGDGLLGLLRVRVLGHAHGLRQPRGLRRGLSTVLFCLLRV